MRLWRGNAVWEVMCAPGAKTDKGLYVSYTQLLLGLGSKVSGQQIGSFWQHTTDDKLMT